MVELSVPGEPQASPQITLDKVQAALRVPVGAASPLWFVFAGAATAGMAFWWMTRWTRPQNLEAMMAVPTPEAPPPPPFAAPTPLAAEPAAEPRSFAAEPEDEPEPAVELAAAPAPQPPIAAEPLTGAALVAEVARLTGLAPPESMPDFEPEPPKAAKKAVKKPPTQN